jgi:hypothetical protein
MLRAPGGDETLDIVDVRYEAIPMDAFVAPKNPWSPTK